MAEEERVKGILAYPIKRTSNYCVKAILLFAHKIIQLQNRVRANLATKIKPTEKPAKISRVHKSALKGTVKMLRMVNWSTTGATRILKKTNGLLTVPLLHFEGGRKLVRKLPLGPATVELSIAIGKVIGALKLGTEQVLKSFESVTTSLMFNRYGEEVAITTSDYMEASGHLLHILWNAVQILDPINLPLDVVPEFYDLYEEIGIEDLKDKIDDEIDIHWPNPIEKINNLTAWEVVATHEKKKKETTS